MPNDTDWQSDADGPKQKKREAANTFLQKTMDDDPFRQAVKDWTKDTATNEFKQMCKDAGIEMPDYVKVICIDDERTERNKLVVFAMPLKGTPMPAGGDWWVDGWLAAWDPY
jgi:hypothetical protein